MAGPIDDGFFDRKKPPTKGGPLDFSRYSSAPLSKPLPVVYGTAWVEGIPLYIDKTSSGWVSEWQDVAGVPSVKGYASGTQALVQMAFCQGPVTSIDYIRRDKVLHHAGATSGGRFNFKHLSAADDQSGSAFSYQPTFTLGDASTASLWSALAAETNPYRRLAYGHLAMMRCERLAFIGGRLPSLFARVRGKLATYADPGILAESTVMGSAQTVYNALPGDVIKDLLTSALWGVGLPAASVVTDVGADGSANSSFDRYCHARGWYIGLAITTAQSAFDVVKMILAATDSTIAVSGSTWKVIPYGDTSVGPRAGYTYAPPTVSIGLTDDDLVQKVQEGDTDEDESPGEEPIELDQIGEEDTRNAFPLTYVPGYGWGEDEAPAESMDVASVSTTGLRRASPRSLPCIRSGPHAQAISALMASRSVYNRTTARFSVTWRHPEVEPGDFVSLTHELLGFVAKTFRVLSTEEGPDGATVIEAVEWNTGVSVVPVYNPQTADGLSYTPTSGGDPVSQAVMDMANDGMLTPAEKPAFFTAVTNVWHAVREGEDAGSADLAIHGTTLTAASLAFYNYLQTIGFEYAWVDIDRVWTDPGDRTTQRGLLAAWMAETTPVVAADYRAAFGAVETAIANARSNRLKTVAKSALMYGAVGDGTTDDTAALQAAIDAAILAGEHLVIEAPVKITDEILIDGPLHVLGRGAGLVTQATANKNLFRVTSSDVTIEALGMAGPQHSAWQDETAVWAEGASAAAPLERVHVRNCKINNFGMYGVHLKWVNNFSVVNNAVWDVHYAGIMGLSVKGGRIVANKVKDIHATTDGYGVALTRATTDSLTTDPRSSDVAVIGNVVDGVPNWEAFDTHGGESINFVGNLALNTKRGINIGPCPGASASVVFAPHNCHVIGNVIRSGVTDGSAVTGISVVGGHATADPVGDPTELASGIVIEGNTIEGHGSQSTIDDGAILCRDTIGLIVRGNSIKEPAPNGILMLYDNYGFSLQGNTIVDPWTNTTTGIGAGRGVRIAGGYNTGFIDGNSIIGGVAGVGAKSATYVNTVGILISADTGNDVLLGLNRITSATPILGGTTVGSQLPAYRKDTTTTGTVSVTLAAQDTVYTFTGALTGNMTVNLATTNCIPGTKVKIIRNGTGNYTMTITSLVTLGANAKGYAEAVFDGADWILSAYGAL